jgi:hypothetical protein
MHATTKRTFIPHPLFWKKPSQQSVQRSTTPQKKKKKEEGKR